MDKNNKPSRVFYEIKIYKVNVNNLWRSVKNQYYSHVKQKEILKLQKYALKILN